MVIRFPNTILIPCRVAPKLKSRRFVAWSDSEIRKDQSHITIAMTSPKSIVRRQVPPIRSNRSPMIGASTGPAKKTVWTIAMTRAMSSPSNLSRIIAWLMVRGAAHPIPQRILDARRTPRFGAMVDPRAPKVNRAIPTRRIGRRPYVSARGPYMGIPMAMPTKMHVIVNPGRFELGSMPNEERSSANAGKSMSIDRAMALVRRAVNAMNSRSLCTRSEDFTLRSHGFVDSQFQLF